DVASKALALREARHVDDVARGEHVGDRDRLAQAVVVDLLDPEFAERGRLWRALRELTELAGGRLADLLRRVGPQLHRDVAVAIDGPQARDGIRLDGEHADAHHGAVVLEDLGHADLAADQSDAHYILISMSTPAASESLINASTVFDDGSRMS